MPDAKRNPAGANGWVSEDQVGARSIPHAPTFDLSTLSPHEFDLFTAGYQSGLLAGLDRGREQEAREQAALWHNAFKTVRFFAAIPTHEELERRRRTYPDAQVGSDAPVVGVSREAVRTDLISGDNNLSPAVDTETGEGANDLHPAVNVETGEVAA